MIGLTGYAGVGKDTVAGILVTDYGYQQRAFADKLRAWAAEINPLIATDDGVVNYNELLKEYGYEKAKREFPAMRQFLVALGNGAREFLGPDVWIEAAVANLPSVGINSSLAGINLFQESGQLPLSAKRIVFSDLRYQNEAAKIRQLGGIIIKITRPGYQANSVVEQSVDQIIPDAIIENNGDFAALKQQLAQILPCR